MASTTYVRDILYRVSDALQDLRPQFTRWTQLSLVTYLNDGQRAIAKYVPSSCSRVDAIKLSAGTKQSLSFIPAANTIPGDGSSPTDTVGNSLLTVVRNMGSDGMTPGDAIRLQDRSALDMYEPSWHTETGTKIIGFTYDPRTPKVFYVTPGVPADTDLWVEASFLADPANISATGDYGYQGSNTTKISVDDKFIDDLVNYMLARAYSKESEVGANAQLAATYGSQFVSSINAQAAAMTGVNPNLQALPQNTHTSTPVSEA